MCCHLSAGCVLSAGVCCQQVCVVSRCVLSLVTCVLSAGGVLSARIELSAGVC